MVELKELALKVLNKTEIEIKKSQPGTLGFDS